MIAIAQQVTALQHALRAPSVHNTQPWRWRLGTTAVDLFADPARHLPATDPEQRDLLLSCGAALHHLVIALAHDGYVAQVVRMPDVEDSTHLARVTVGGGRPDPRDVDLFNAIADRHTDRRRMSHRPVPAPLLSTLADAAGGFDVLLVPASGVREQFAAALADAAERQRWVPGYAAELQIWTRRYPGGRDGIPTSAIAAPPSGLTGPSGLRRFPHAGLSQPLPRPGHGLPDDAAEFFVFATDDDRPEDRLRAGEALSAVLLTATRHGLATTPLSQGTEIAASQETLRRIVGIPEHPQMVLRVGWAAADAGELSPTPRRDVTSVMA
jgi:hypothetical protein